MTAAAAALATAAVLTLPPSAGAAETSPVGFGAGTTGGGLRLKNVSNVVVRNVSPDTKIAVTTNRSSDVDGYANLRGHDLGGAATEISRVGTFTSPPYGYTAESASTVAASVTGGAGAGKL
ncbi:hypothetical protein [Streptomyces chartreusis]